MTEEAALAKRDFDGNRWVDAAIALDRVQRGETGDDRGNRQIAQYQLAIALYNLRLYQASLGIFAEIARTPSHNKYKETVLWLARLAIQLPEPAGVATLLLPYRQDLEDRAPFGSAQQHKLYSQLSYLSGRAEYSTGALQQAVELFAAIDQQSAYFPGAKVMEGAAWVRLGKAAPAIRAFRRAQSAVEGKDDEDARRIRSIAALSQARIFYSASFRGSGPADASVDARGLTAALIHYDRVPLGEHSQDALVESACARYLAGDFSRSLGLLTTAKSPMFNAPPRPEADRLEALIAYGTCRYEDALSRLAQSRSAREPVRRNVADLLQRFRDAEPGELMSWAKRTQTGAGAETPSAPVVEALSKRRVRRYLNHVKMIERERQSFQTAPARLHDSSIGAFIREELALDATRIELIRTPVRERLTKGGSPLDPAHEWVNSPHSGRRRR